MTKEELAGRLNGRQYRDEMTEGEEQTAHAHGLLVVFGASDDLVEFRGAVTDEIGMCDGGLFLLDAQGPVPERDNEWTDDEMAAYLARKKRAVPVVAEWCERGEYSWSFRCPVPCAEFDVREGDEPYCRGIVIDTNDLPK